MPAQRLDVGDDAVYVVAGRLFLHRGDPVGEFVQLVQRVAARLAGVSSRLLPGIASHACHGSAAAGRCDHRAWFRAPLVDAH